MNRAFFFVMSLLTLFGFSQTPINAQEDMCADIAQQAITNALETCAGLPYDHVCHNMPGVFSRAGEFIPLESMQSVLSVPLDIGEETYGVAILNTSAALPRMIGDQGVTYLLLGEMKLENEVEPDSAFVPVDPIPVTTVSGANIRTGSSLNDSIITSVNYGTEFMADGLNDAGDWVRIVVEDNPAWIYRPLVTDDGLDALPTIAPTSRSLMQDFSLETKLWSECSDAPNILIVQGLDLQPVTLQVNGAEIRFRGTVALRSTSRTLSEFFDDPFWFGEYSSLTTDLTAEADTECRFIELAAVDGDAFLNNGRLSIPRGYRATTFDCDPDREESVLWNRAFPMSPLQLNALEFLETVPETVLRNPVNVTTPQEVARMTAQIASASNNRPATTNNTTTTSAPVSEPAPGPVECPGFVPTRPIDSIPFGRVRFYWDPAPGATSYQVNVYNYADQLIVSSSSQGAQTSALVETFSPAFGLHNNRQPPMSYEVIAYQDGNVLCQTARLHLLRDFDPDPDCPPSMWFPDRCPEDIILNDK